MASLRRENLGDSMLTAVRMYECTSPVTALCLGRGSRPSFCKMAKPQSLTRRLEGAFGLCQSMHGLLPSPQRMFEGRIALEAMTAERLWWAVYGENEG